MTNTDKKTAEKVVTSKAPTGKTPAGKTSSPPQPGQYSFRPIWLAIIGVLAAAAIAAGIVY